MSKAINPMNGLPVIHQRAAGIDIGSRFHVVAVPTCSGLQSKTHKPAISAFFDQN